MSAIVGAAVRYVKSYWHSEAEPAKLIEPRAIGQALPRVEGRDKVLGTARYAYEHPLDAPLYLYALQSTIARGRITAIDASHAERLPGVVAVLTHENAPRLADDDDPELFILQSPKVSFRGQIIGGVVAETPEIARHAASLVRVEYEPAEHAAELRVDDGDAYVPKTVNGGYEPESAQGDVADAMHARSPHVTVDETYTTPMEHNNPMEPHTCVAVAAHDRLTLYSSTQGVHDVRTAIAAVFGLDEGAVRVIAPHVGGGFGSKGVPHAHDVLAVMAARRSAGRPVKLALTRQQMFALVGYRTPTIQRVRLAADDDGTLAAIGHEVVEVTSRWKEFAEQTAVPSRILYAASSRATCHRLVPLDVAAPSWMRAPGEMPGMFAAEVAIDELAIACGVDPIELRIRNDPPSDPESGLPWSGRHLVDCLREGARRFDWRRRAKPAERRANGWLVGLGVASSTYPRYILPGSKATVRYLGDGRYTVAIGAVDIGTGTWTALAQIAADALGRPFDAVRLEIGDSELPHGSVEGGSSGISSWGGAVVAAARAFRDAHGLEPAPGVEATAATPEDSAEGKFSTHSFGAQFAEVHVHEDSGEVRVPCLLGVFSVGRIINPRTARSQLIGGMTMGLSAALHEESILDPRFGHVVNHDLAGYHIATHADVKNIEAIWFDECDEHSNAIGSRGIGEIGIVGTAAAIANAVCHATGVRIRSLPITLDKLVGSLR